MLELFLTDAYMPFTVSFLLMGMIGIVEIIGLGVGSVELDVAPDIDGPSGPTILDWLGIGEKMPFLIWLTSFLASYTMGGFILQQSMEVFTDHPLPWPAAAVLGIFPALLINFFLANLLHKVIPGLETNAIHPDELVGCRATILDGDASKDKPSRGQIIDKHGQMHVVLIEPHEDQILPAGERVLIVRKDGLRFYAVTDDIPHLRAV